MKPAGLTVAVVIAALATVLGSPVSAGSQAAPSVAPDEPMTAVDIGRTPARNSPLIVADPTNRRFVVAATRIDAPKFSCGLEVSGDGGRSWIGARPVPNLPPGADSCYAPDVEFDRSGRLYYLFVGLRAAGNVPMGVFLTTSTDRGRTFSPPRRVLGANVYGTRMVMDRSLGRHGRLHLVWLQASGDAPLGGFPAPPNPILAAHSDDGGRTFTPPVTIDSSGRRLTAPTVALGPDRAVHVLAYDLVDDVRDYQGLEGPTWAGNWSLLLFSSRDGGVTFGPSRVVDADIVPPERVMLVFVMPPASIATDRRGVILVAWADARNGDWDVLLRRSTDGGSSWEAPVRLNDDSVANGKHQYLPRLSTAPAGRVDAVFYDRRDDPANIRTNVSYTWSNDGGRSFAPNVALNSESFDSRAGQRYLVPSAMGLVESGSRLGLLSEDSRVLAAWADGRNAFGPVSEVSPTDQDIYATEVRFAGR